jgi:hypothetical protein
MLQTSASFPHSAMMSSRLLARLSHAIRPEAEADLRAMLHGTILGIRGREVAEVAGPIRACKGTDGCILMADSRPNLIYLQHAFDPSITQAGIQLCIDVEAIVASAIYKRYTSQSRLEVVSFKASRFN